MGETAGVERAAWPPMTPRTANPKAGGGPALEMRETWLVRRAVVKIARTRSEIEGQAQ